MFRKSRATATIVAVLMALGLTLNPSGLSPAQATPAPESFNDTRPVTSEPVEVDFAVQYLGVVADLAPGVTEADPQGAIRTARPGSEFRANGRSGNLSTRTVPKAKVSSPAACCWQTTRMPTRCAPCRLGG